MAFTTPGTAVAGEVLTAAFWNEQVRDNANFLYAPPMVQVRRTTDINPYTNDAAIAWSGEAYDTDGMYTDATSTTNVNINTAGVYIINFVGRANTTSATRILPAIRKAGTEIARVEANLSTGQAIFGMSTIETLAVSDVITATVGIVSGSGYIIKGAASGFEQTRLSLTWIGFA